MKTIKPLLLLSVIFLTFSPITEIYGQACNVTKDSVTAGSGAGNFSTYTIDPMGRVAQAYYTDSGNVSGPSRAIIIIFDGGSELPVEYRFVDTGTQTIYRVFRYTRDSGNNNRISTVFDSTMQATTTHTVSYDGSGNISAVTLSNSTGTPDFPASFSGFVWQNGNITAINLVIGGTTVELTVATDNKNNIKKKLPPVDGIADIFQTETANNITNATFINDEVVNGNNISAGSHAIHQQYTYNSNNDVETLSDLPSAFNNGNSSTKKFFYNCPTAIGAVSAAEISVYPNPTADYISMGNGAFDGLVKIFDIKGKEVKRFTADNQPSLNITDLLPGMYYLEIADGDKIYRGKILKN